MIWDMLPPEESLNVDNRNNAHLTLPTLQLPTPTFKPSRFTIHTQDMNINKTFSYAVFNAILKEDQALLKYNDDIMTSLHLG